jgi:hypothetical protein
MKLRWPPPKHLDGCQARKAGPQPRGLSSASRSAGPHPSLLQRSLTSLRGSPLRFNLPVFPLPQERRRSIPLLAPPQPRRIRPSSWRLCQPPPQCRKPLLPRRRRLQGCSLRVLLTLLPSAPHPLLRRALLTEAFRLFSPRVYSGQATKLLFPLRW